MKKNKVILLLILLVAFNIGKSQTAKYSNEFLSIGVGAKALGMANSVVSNTDDVYSTYWNPAGLNNLSNDMQVAFMHSEYFAGIAKYDFGAFALKLSDKNTVGLSLVRFGVDDIPNTLELIDNEGNIRYDRVKSFSAYDLAVMLSLARKSSIENLQYGANIKVIRRKAGDFASAWGFGFDVGAKYKYKKWLIGAMARDITSTFNSWTFNTDELEQTFILTGNKIPTNSTEITLPKLLLGVAREFPIYKKISGLAELDMDFTFDGKRNTIIKSDFASIDPHIGLEANYNKIIFLRMGVNNIQKYTDIGDKQKTSFQPSIGLGVAYRGLSIDYAFTDIGNASIALYSNVISLKYSFNKETIKNL